MTYTYENVYQRGYYLGFFCWMYRDLDVHKTAGASAGESHALYSVEVVERKHIINTNKPGIKPRSKFARSLPADTELTRRVTEAKGRRRAVVAAATEARRKKRATDRKEKV